MMILEMEGRWYGSVLQGALKETRPLCLKHRIQRTSDVWAEGDATETHGPHGGKQEKGTLGLSLD